MHFAHHFRRWNSGVFAAAQAAVGRVGRRRARGVLARKVERRSVDETFGHVPLLRVIDVICRVTQVRSEVTPSDEHGIDSQAQNEVKCWAGREEFIMSLGKK